MKFKKSILIYSVAAMMTLASCNAVTPASTSAETSASTASTSQTSEGTSASTGTSESPVVTSESEPAVSESEPVISESQDESESALSDTSEHYGPDVSESETHETGLSTEESEDESETHETGLSTQEAESETHETGLSTEESEDESETHETGLSTDESASESEEPIEDPIGDFLLEATLAENYTITADGFNVIELFDPLGAMLVTYVGDYAQYGNFGYITNPNQGTFEYSLEDDEVVLGDLVTVRTDIDYTQAFMYGPADLLAAHAAENWELAFGSVYSFVGDVMEDVYAYYTAVYLLQLAGFGSDSSSIVAYGYFDGASAVVTEDSISFSVSVGDGQISQGITIDSIGTTSNEAVEAYLENPVDAESRNDYTAAEKEILVGFIPDNLAFPFPGESYGVSLEASKADDGEIYVSGQDLLGTEASAKEFAKKIDEAGYDLVKEEASNDGSWYACLEVENEEEQLVYGVEIIFMSPEYLELEEEGSSYLYPEGLVRFAVYTESSDPIDVIAGLIDEADMEPLPEDLYLNNVKVEFMDVTDILNAQIEEGSEDEYILGLSITVSFADEDGALAAFEALDAYWAEVIDEEVDDGVEGLIHYQNLTDLSAYGYGVYTDTYMAQLRGTEVVVYLESFYQAPIQHTPESYQEVLEEEYYFDFTYPLDKLGEVDQFDVYDSTSYHEEDGYILFSTLYFTYLTAEEAEAAFGAVASYYEALAEAELVGEVRIEESGLTIYYVAYYLNEEETLIGYWAVYLWDYEEESTDFAMRFAVSLEEVEPEETSESEPVWSESEEPVISESEEPVISESEEPVISESEEPVVEPTVEDYQKTLIEKYGFPEIFPLDTFKDANFLVSDWTAWYQEKYGPSYILVNEVYFSFETAEEAETAYLALIDYLNNSESFFYDEEEQCYAYYTYEEETSTLSIWSVYTGYDGGTQISMSIILASASLD
ncbi:MAG: hypothetical protein SPL00_01290 [Bacilli bacterium]|nr:hypothetical protein [Bacilli bacterium]